MSYIGNTPFTAAFLVDTFSGNGSTVAFTMTVAPANTSSIIVAVTGVLQDPSTYSVSGTTLTFSAAPPSGTSNISVRYLGIPASGVTTTAYRTVTEFTATAGQTSFSVPSYTVGYIDVYRNGVRLVSTDYTATTGTTVVLVNACTSGDAVVTESFLVSSVLNALPTTGGTIGGNLVVTGTETVPTITSPAATALTLQTNNGTTAITIDTSQNVFVGGTTQNTSTKPVYSSSTAKAWINFSGGGTTINSSFNVSSITYIGTGTTTINFTSAMPNANYAMSINNSFASGTTEAVFGVCYNDAPYAPTTSSVTVKFYRGDTNAAINPTLGYVLIFST